jgi:hypothetical protein
MALNTDSIVLDLIKSMARVEDKIEKISDILMKAEMEERGEKKDDASYLLCGGGMNGAMADSSYDSSTSTYDGLPTTGAYNGGFAYGN